MLPYLNAYAYLLIIITMTVIIWVVDHHGPVMEVSGQDPGLTENPVNHCGRLWLAVFHQLTLAEVQIIPGGEISVEINVVGIESPGAFLPAKTLALSTLLKPFC